MNFNASGVRHPNKLGAKRVKPPMDPMAPPPSYPPPYNPYANAPSSPPVTQYQDYSNSQPIFDPYASSSQPGNTYNPNVPYGMQPSVPDPGIAIGSALLSGPIINSAAMTYGQHLMGTGKNYVDKEFEKYVPVSRLKYYFAVDTTYVYKKLGLIFFPYAHKDWSVKYAANEPVQPKYEVNAPDLYIPTMAYLTYVFVAGLALGAQDRFTPEVLGIVASSALAWTILEILVHLISLYITAISTSLTPIDILAFSGYKYVGIIFSVLTSLIFFKLGYYISLIYFSVSLSFFLIRTLKIKILPVNSSPADPYSMQQQRHHHQGGDKRRLYLLLFIAGVQPVLMWWLSYHLVPSTYSTTQA